MVVGELAKKRGSENARRLVSSAKSWLSHTGVDRTSPILPPNAPEGVDRVSPVEASRRYLEHMRAAWNHQHPDLPFDEQQVLVTVPASFDAVARELTLEAARQAGYKDVCCSKSRRQRSTPGSSGIRTGASGWESAT